MREPIISSSALSLGKASPPASSARNVRQARHGQDLLAAQAVLLPLVLLASAVGSAALILTGSQAQWPHPLIVAQIALAFAQLGTLSLFAALVPRARTLCVTAMVVLAFIWSKCLGYIELDFARWAGLMVALTLPPVAALVLLRWRGLRLYARKPEARESQDSVFEQQQTTSERSPWQFSLGSLMALTTLTTIALSGIRVLELDWRAGMRDAGFGHVELALAVLPLVSLSLAFLLLAGAGQRQMYYAVTAALTVGAVACLGAAVTVGFSSSGPQVWTLQLCACYGLFAGGYLVIARQCGARLVWRKPSTSTP